MKHCNMLPHVAQSGLRRTPVPTEGLINVSGIYPSWLNNQCFCEGICNNLHLFYQRDLMLKGEDFKHIVRCEQEVVFWARDTEKGSSCRRNTSTLVHVNEKRTAIGHIWEDWTEQQEVRLWQISLKQTERDSSESKHSYLKFSIRMFPVFFNAHLFALFQPGISAELQKQKIKQHFLYFWYSNNCRITCGGCAVVFQSAGPKHFPTRDFSKRRNFLKRRQM